MWIRFAKRLVVILAVCVTVTMTLTFLTGWNPWNLFFLFFAEGTILLLFGACLGTSMVEAVAYGKYGVNPPVVRDTRRHFTSRRQEQEKSSLLLLVAGAILLVVGIVGLSLLYLPH